MQHSILADIPITTRAGQKGHVAIITSARLASGGKWTFPRAAGCGRRDTPADPKPWHVKHMVARMAAKVLPTHNWKIWLGASPHGLLLVGISQGKRRVSGGPPGHRGQSQDFPVRRTNFEIRATLAGRKRKRTVNCPRSFAVSHFCAVCDPVTSSPISRACCPQ